MAASVSKGDAETWRDLYLRLTGAKEQLAKMISEADDGWAGTVRLEGKLQGVKLALGYMEEMNRARS